MSASKIKPKSTFYITDWIGNVLDFRGRFLNPQFAVAMKFDSFDDAEMYLDEQWGDKYEENREDVFVLEFPS